MGFLKAWAQQHVSAAQPAPRRVRMARPRLRIPPPELPEGVNDYPPEAAAAAPPRAGEQVELPCLNKGLQQQTFTFGPNISANTSQRWEAEAGPYDWMDLQVVGVKVVAHLNGPLLGVDALNPYAPPKVAQVDPRAQASIVLTSARLGGSLDMVPAPQIMDVGGRFGRSSDKLFSGLRHQDVMWANSRCTVEGVISPAFSLPDNLEAVYTVALKIALIVVILRDFRRDPPRRYRDYWRGL